MTKADTLKTDEHLEEAKEALFQARHLTTLIRTVAERISGDVCADDRGNVLRALEESAAIAEGAAMVYEKVQLALEHISAADAAEAKS